MMQIFSKSKNVVLCVSLLLTLLLPAGILLAQGTASIQNLTKDTGAAAGYSVGTSPSTDLAKLAGNIARVFLSLVGVLFISYTIYGGFLWMTAAGNEEQVGKAKTIIRQGIIGLIVIFSAAAIYAIVVAILSGRGTVTGSGTQQIIF